MTMAGDTTRGLSRASFDKRVSVDGLIVHFLNIVVAFRAVHLGQLFGVRKVDNVRVAIGASHPRVRSVVVLEIRDVHIQAGTIFGKFLLVSVTEHAVFVFPLLGKQGRREKD